MEFKGNIWYYHLISADLQGQSSLLYIKSTWSHGTLSRLLMDLSRELEYENHGLQLNTEVKHPGVIPEYASGKKMTREWRKVANLAIS